MYTILFTMTLLAIANTTACDSTKPETTPAKATSGITVTCGRTLGIDESAASRGDWGGTSEWSAEAHGDTLVLTRSGACGDECRYEEKIVFASITDACPKLVSASVTKTDHGDPVPTPRVQSAVDGTLEIQDWNPSGGIVSGRVQAQFTLDFHVKTSAPKSEP